MFSSNCHCIALDNNILSSRPLIELKPKLIVIFSPLSITWYVILQSKTPLLQSFNSTRFNLFQKSSSCLLTFNFLNHNIKTTIRAEDVLWKHQIARLLSEIIWKWNFHSSLKERKMIQWNKMSKIKFLQILII